MLDKMLDTYSKAVESTLKLQQEMLGKLTDEWAPAQPKVREPRPAAPPSTGSPPPAEAALEQFELAQKKWAELVKEMLNRHRETLDEQYKAGIRLLDDAFRAGEVKDPEQFRRFSEELWQRSLKTLETAVGSHLHDVQAVVQKWFEATSAGVKGSFEQIRSKS